MFLIMRKSNALYTLSGYLHLHLLLFVMVTCSYATSSHYGIFIGHNRGDITDVHLKYSETDAQKMASIFSDYGELEEENMEMLLSPTKKQIVNAFSRLGEKLKSESTATENNSVFIFYFSGHGDRNKMKLGSSFMTYPEFNELFDAFPAKVKIGFFDACASGGIIRNKGVNVIEPIRIKKKVTAEGSVLISSSAHNELSHESDELGGSFFTHYFVNGLRGAADISGDYKVSLMEAYHYAYNNTLIQSQTLWGSSQHPNAQFKMKLEGDLILTNLNENNTGVILDSKLRGSFTIANSHQEIIADVEKTNSNKVLIALNAGDYTVYQKNESEVNRLGFNLKKHDKKMVYQKDLTKAERRVSNFKGKMIQDIPKYYTTSSVSLGVGKAFATDLSVKISLKYFVYNNFYLALEPQFDQIQTRQYRIKTGLGYRMPNILYERLSFSIGPYYSTGLVGQYQGEYIFKSDIELIAGMHIRIINNFFLEVTAGYSFYEYDYDEPFTYDSGNKNQYHGGFEYVF